MNDLTEIIYVEKYRQLFIETKNPIYAWRVFQNARAMRYPIPQEVLNYIANVAHDIVKVAQNPPVPAKRPVALSKALKLHKSVAGQGSAFTEYSSRLKKRKLAIEVVQSEYYEPDLLDYAFEDVSKKTGKSKSAIRENFLKHREQWRTVAQNLVESGLISFTPDGRIEMAIAGSADDLREAAAILDEIQHIKEA